MKIKKFILLLIFCLFFAVKVNAETLNDTVVVEDTTNVIYASTYFGSSATTHTAYKIDTNGNIVYCTDETKAFGGGTFTLNTSTSVSPAIAYIIENGFNKDKISSDDAENKKNYLITQYAVWYYVDPTLHIFNNMDFSAGTYAGVSNDVVKEIAKLINGASAYKEAGEPSISINNTNKTLSKSSDDKYYVSSPLSVNTTGVVSNYTVSLDNAPTGTFVTDMNGEVKTTFSTGSSFMVKVPVDSINSLNTNFDVIVSATASKAYMYDSSNSAYQNIFALYLANGDINNRTTLNLSITNKVIISKQDATTGKELPGAQLILKDSDGKEVDSWTSKSTPHQIENLAPGKYTLIEKIAPEGYQLSSETVTFTVKNDGTVDGMVVMKNQPEIIENPPTKTVAIIIAWVVGLAAIGYSIYYFAFLRKNKVK